MFIRRSAGHNGASKTPEQGSIPCCRAVPGSLQFGYRLGSERSPVRVRAPPREGRRSSVGRALKLRTASFIQALSGSCRRLHPSFASTESGCDSRRVHGVVVQREDVAMASRKQGFDPPRLHHGTLAPTGRAPALQAGGCRFDPDRFHRVSAHRACPLRWCSSKAEHLLGMEAGWGPIPLASSLAFSRASFNGRTPDFHSGYVGSIPSARSMRM